MEAQLDKGLLLVLGQGSEYLCSVQQMVLVDKLVDVVSQQGQVQQECKPEAVEQKQHREEGMNSCLGQVPGVQLTAQLNGVDVVTLQIRVHDGKEYLGKQVDGIDHHCEHKQPLIPSLLV